jgi:precorrin-6B methylase 2
VVKKTTTRYSDFFARWRRFLSCYSFTLFEILATRINLFDQCLSRWRKPVLLQEIRLLDISSEDSVLHLGCGALPSASLFIAQKRNVHVTGIDNNMIAVRLGQSYIKKKHLSTQIAIEYGDGTTYPVQDFDVIFIAINVWPIDHVLFHLTETMKPTARILCKGLHNDVSTLLKKKEFQTRYTVISRLQHGKTESLLLNRKK